MRMGWNGQMERSISIGPVQPRKVVLLERWADFLKTFSVGPNRKGPTWNRHFVPFCPLFRRGSRGGEMGEFSPPPPPLFFLNHADAQTSNTSTRLWFYYIITKIHPPPHFKILDPRLLLHSSSKLGKERRLV